MADDGAGAGRRRGRSTRAVDAAASLGRRGRRRRRSEYDVTVRRRSESDVRRERAVRDAVDGARRAGACAGARCCARPERTAIDRARAGRRLVVDAAAAASTDAPAVVRAVILAVRPASIADREAEVATHSGRGTCAHGGANPAPVDAAPAAERGSDPSDARWLWALALALLGIETWMRRRRDRCRTPRGTPCRLNRFGGIRRIRLQACCRGAARIRLRRTAARRRRGDARRGVIAQAAVFGLGVVAIVVALGSCCRGALLAPSGRGDDAAHARRPRSSGPTRRCAISSFTAAQLLESPEGTRPYMRERVLREASHRAARSICGGRSAVARRARAGRGDRGRSSARRLVRVPAPRSVPRPISQSPNAPRSPNPTDLVVELVASGLHRPSGRRGS